MMQGVTFYGVACPLWLEEGMLQVGARTRSLVYEEAVLKT